MGIIDKEGETTEPLAQSVEEIDAMALELKELREIERKRIPKEDFLTASQLPPSPKTVWVAVGDAWGFYKALHEATLRATNTANPKDYWKKVLIDVGDDGRLSNIRLED